MSATPTERRMAAQIANAVRWSRQSQSDRKVATAPARRGLEAKWAKEIDPDGTMSPEELELRIESARKAHMLRMSLASAKARRAKGGRAA